MKRSFTSSNKTKRLTLLGLLLSLALILSFVESALPPLPLILPGVKFGLSNIMVMYTLFFLGRGEATAIVLLKAVFVLTTRGVVAGILSLCGGILSLAVMALLMLLFREKASYLLLSIAGACFHNIGQLFAARLIYSNLYLWAELPLLLVFGVVAGIATAGLLRLLLPAIKSIRGE